MLIENEKVKKVHLMGLVHQTLAGEKQGLKTMEIWLITLPPGSETPADQHYGEVVGMTLKGTGRATVDEDKHRLGPRYHPGYPSPGYPPGGEHRRGRPGNPGHQEFGAPPGKNDAGDIGKPAVILVSIMLNVARRFLNPAQGESHDNC